MGHTIWVDVQGRAEDDVPSDNSIMLRLEEQLERLAEKLGVSKLSSFYDYSVLEDELAEFVEDAGRDNEHAPEVAGEARSRGQWFDPSAALAAVRAIRQHLLRHPADLDFTPNASRSHWPADLMDELAHVQSVLEAAASQNKRFRLLIVP
jgi:hypothetical protein